MLKARLWRDVETDAREQIQRRQRKTRSYYKPLGTLLRNTLPGSEWVISLLERKPARLATVAMANKTARIVWVVLTRNEPYTPHTA